jgi:hypothetical protein
MPIVGWTACAIFIISGIYAFMGGKPGVATIELNSLAHVCLAVWTLVVSVLLGSLYRHESDAVTGIFALVESRKRNRWRWILNGVVLVPMVAAAAWLALYGGLSRFNTNLAGPVKRRDAVISRVYHLDYGWKCLSVEVRLEDDSEHEICVDTGVFNNNLVPANASCAALGDVAKVVEMHTVLGKTLTLVSIDAPSC